MSSKKNTEHIQVNVLLWGKRIGVLTWDDTANLAVFQPTPEFNDFGFEVSPISHRRIIGGKEMTARYGLSGDKYQGLPPFIADSLPDDWGNRLFDQWLSENSMPSIRSNTLYKLSFIGKRGMGALEFVPELEPDNEEQGFSVNVKELKDLAIDIYRGRQVQSLPAKEKLTLKRLVQLGTSAGGKHPKGIIAISDKTGEIRSGQVNLPEEFRYYIVKFKEDPDIPTSEIELVYSQMAREAGIEMMPCRLLNVEGENHFLTERFDRQDGRKIYKNSLAAITPGASDYTNLFRLCETMRLPEGTREKMFRQMAFNFAAGISDDHDKNFSFLMDERGHWRLSPAYDLMFTSNIWENGSADIHCLGVSGKRVHVTLQDLAEFGNDFDIHDVNGILEDVCKATARFRHLCTTNGIPDEWPDRIDEALDAIFPERKRYKPRLSKQDVADLASMGLDEGRIARLEKNGILHVSRKPYRAVSSWDTNDVPAIKVSWNLEFLDGTVFIASGKSKMKIPLRQAVADTTIMDKLVRQAAKQNPENMKETDKKPHPKK